VDDTRDNGQQDDAKRQYVKPEIKEVPLRPDEAVLGGCKTSSKSGSTQFRCNSPHNCSALTS
jgi:hypothetical protein